MLRIISLILIFIFSPINTVKASNIEQVFSEAQKEYDNMRYEQSAVLFLEVAKMLLNSGQAQKSYAVMNNAGIAYIKGEKYSEAAEVYENILQNSDKIPNDIKAKCFTNLISCRAKLSQHALLAQTIERELKAITKMPKDALANAYAQLGDAYRHMELYGPAVANYDKALFFLKENGDLAVRARVLTAMGLCQGNLGNFDSASKTLTEARKLAEATNALQVMVESDSNLGVLQWERGDYQHALQLLDTAIDTEEKNKLRRNQGVDKNNIGLVWKSMGNYQNAMSMFQDALSIAREVGDKKDEAIALANCALLNRITGRLTEARNNYSNALNHFEEINFQEGKAGALLGIGKIAELEDRNYVLALSNYRESLNIYSKIGLVRSRAEALLQIAGVLKRVATPGRCTRDLVFDDEPVAPKLSKAEAVTMAKSVYEEVLQIAEQIGSKEFLWAAHQGLGYCFFQEGDPEKAFDQYMLAIDVVTKLRNNLANVELLGEYMAGKEDLYGEALEVCAELHGNTEDPKYIEKQIQLDETLRNEIQKASSALMQFEFNDPKKRQLYDDLLALGRRQAKAEAAVPAIVELPANADSETKKYHDLKKMEAEQQKGNIKKLDGDYKKLLDEWCKKYPEDRVVFESSSRVKIPDVQAVLTDDQIMLQYIQLPDNLFILAVTKEKVDSYMVPVDRKTMDRLVRDDFLVNYIELYGHQKISDEDGIKRWQKSLSRLYQYLITPVKLSLEGINRIYVVTDGFLGQVPFSALVESLEPEGPSFLVEKYDIANIRPSFIASLTDKNKKKSTKKILAVGNPRNTKLSLPELKGAQKEAVKASEILPVDRAMKDVEFEHNASEKWLSEKLRESRYEYIYFATHGVPYSEVYCEYILKYSERYEKMNNAKKKLEASEKKKGENEAGYRRDLLLYEKYSKYINDADFIKSSLKTNSPLNGFLYFSNTDDFDGLFTIKEVTEYSRNVFADTKYVILSACNTGVTFSPKTLLQQNDETREALSALETEDALRKSGWIPGVDQISFVDAFMRRGINNVYGTLWFADDAASEYLMSNFMKNLISQGDMQDAVKAYNQVVRQYIANSKAGNNPLGDNNAKYPLHPFFWAAGAMFGK